MRYLLQAFRYTYTTGLLSFFIYRNQDCLPIVVETLFVWWPLIWSAHALYTSPALGYSARA